MVDEVFEILKQLFLGFPVDDDKILSSAERLTKAPTESIIRINTLKLTPQEGLRVLSTCNIRHTIIPSPDFPYVFHVPSLGPFVVSPKERRVIISIDCGRAVLRGAPVYAPGVLGIEDGYDNKVSIWVDLGSRCTRGLRSRYPGQVSFVANGAMRMDRTEIFSPAAHGIAISVEEIEWVHPSFSFLEKSAFCPQNLPSIIAVEALEIVPGLKVLDMCAAPGHKTSHIGALLKNSGSLTAIEKNKSRFDCMKSSLATMGVECTCLNMDSSSAQIISYLGKESFDRILVDPPCSGLGQRPVILIEELCNKADFASYQMRILERAYNLLKPGGIIVYSTCTLSPYENEQIVRHGLNLGLRLTDINMDFGEPGIPSFGIDRSECMLMKRFWPCGPDDTNSFFIAKLAKPL